MIESGSTTSRAEHLKWCKDRAIAYAESDTDQAFASMASDMSKHPETANHPGLELGVMLLMTGKLRGGDEMRRFIEGFN